jgi:hypothetical protein
MHETGYTATLARTRASISPNIGIFQLRSWPCAALKAGHPRRAGCVAGLSQQLAGEAHHAHRQAVCGFILGRADR